MLKCSEGDEGRGHPEKGKFRRVDARVFGEGVLKMERTVEMLQGEVSIYCGPLDLVNQQGR